MECALSNGYVADNLGGPITPPLTKNTLISLFAPTDFGTRYRIAHYATVFNIS